MPASHLLRWQPRTHQTRRQPRRNSRPNGFEVHLRVGHVRVSMDPNRALSRGQRNTSLQIAHLPAREVSESSIATANTQDVPRVKMSHGPGCNTPNSAYMRAPALNARVCSGRLTYVRLKGENYKARPRTSTGQSGRAPKVSKNARSLNIAVGGHRYAYSI